MSNNKIIEYTDQSGDVWFVDENDNRASVRYFGSREKAIESLESLTSCYSCVNCISCYSCYSCELWEFMSAKKKLEVIPSIIDIHRRVYEAASQPDALNMKVWHYCETTHCRAGWVVTLAGQAGRELEEQTSTPLAAMLIYKASGYEISPARFFDSNEDALADMKRLAEEEICQP